MTAASCTRGMWGTQALVHKFLQLAPAGVSVRTYDPAVADYFFVPAYPKCVLDQQGLSENKVNAM